MAGNDQVQGRPGGESQPDDQGQPRVSRRSLLGAAGAGAAGLAAGALVSGAPALAAARKPAAGREQKDAGEPVVVHLKDARTGELDVYRGTSHTRVRDRDLAARLLGTIR